MGIFPPLVTAFRKWENNSNWAHCSLGSEAERRWTKSPKMAWRPFLNNKYSHAKTIHVGGGGMKGIWMHTTPNRLAMKCIKITNKSCTTRSSGIWKMIEHLWPARSQQLLSGTMQYNNQGMWLSGCGWEGQWVHQMHDNRLRSFYTERVPRQFQSENTFLQVRCQWCWQNPGYLVLLASHPSDHVIGDEIN